MADSLCAATLAAGVEPLVVPDAARDPRVGSYLRRSWAASSARYLGVPLVVFDGSAVGTLAVYSQEAAGLVRRRRHPAAPARRLRRHRARALRPGARVRGPPAALRAGHRRRRDRQLRLGPRHRPAGLGRPAGGDLRLRPRAPSTRRSRRSRRGCHPDDRVRTVEALQAAIDTLRGVRRRVPHRAALRGDPLGPGPRPGRSPTTTARAVRLLGAGFDTTGQRHADARVARVLEAMNVRLLLPRPRVALHLRQRRGRAGARRARGRSCSADRSGSSSRPRWAATSRSTTAAPWPPARSGCSRPTTRHRSTPGTRSAPGRARTGCRSTSSTSPSGGRPRTGRGAAPPAWRVIADVAAAMSDALGESGARRRPSRRARPSGGAGARRLGRSPA